MVSTIVLNGAELTDRETAHAYLARMLSFPDWYGNNLDALYDCLTEMGPCTILLLGADALRRAGGYGAKILSTLEDAARDDPDLRLLTGGTP